MVDLEGVFLWNYHSVDKYYHSVIIYIYKVCGVVVFL